MSGFLGSVGDKYYLESEERLVTSYAKAYKDYGGGDLDPERLYKDWKLLHVLKTLIASFLSIAAPRHIPWKTLKKVKSEKEPVFADNFEGRGYTRLVISTLVRWKKGHAYKYFKLWQEDFPEKKVSRGLSWFLFYKPWHFFHDKLMRLILFFYRMTR